MQGTALGIPKRRESPALHYILLKNGFQLEESCVQLKEAVFNCKSPTVP